MKKILLLAAISALFACNNSKKEPATGAVNNNDKPAEKTTVSPATTGAGEAKVVYTADGVEIKNAASVLVTKDEAKLQAGAPYRCMLTSNAASNNDEYLGITFLMNTKPGTYPVVSYSFQRGKSPNDEMYGSLLGGNNKITEHKITITECKDLGSNNTGGHKWSISGFWENISMKAMPIMLTDKSKSHPAEVMLDKGSFYNLTFDDNFDEMLEELKKTK